MFLIPGNFYEMKYTALLILFLKVSTNMLLLAGGPFYPAFLLAEWMLWVDFLNIAE